MSEDWLSVAVVAAAWVGLLYGLYGAALFWRGWRYRRLKRIRAIRLGWK